MLRGRKWGTWGVGGLLRTGCEGSAEIGGLGLGSDFGLGRLVVGLVGSGSKGHVGLGTEELVRPLQCYPQFGTLSSKFDNFSLA